MHLIDGPGATSDHRFVYEDRARGIAKTIATDTWLNAVQEELVNAVLSGDVALSKPQNDQLARALSRIAGLRSSGRNLLINGDFRFWQRDNATVGVFVAVTAPAGRKYTTDRWAVTSDGSTSGAGQSTLARMPFALGQTEVPGEPSYFLRFTQATASTLGAPRMDQRIEDVRRTAGRTLTLSGSLSATAPLTIGARLVQDFGVGGSADNLTASQNLDVGTDFAPFEISFDVDDVAGATIGPGSFLELRFTLPNAVGFTLDFADLQLEFGASASGFERRPDWIELPRCQRFFETSWGYETAVGSNVQGGSVAGPQVGTTAGYADMYQAIQTRFRVPKRSTPTVVWYSLTGAVNKVTLAGNAPFVGGTDDPEFAVASVQNPSEQGTGWARATGIVTTLSGWAIEAAHWTADAEL